MEDMVKKVMDLNDLQGLMAFMKLWVGMCQEALLDYESQIGQLLVENQLLAGGIRTLKRRIEKLERGKKDGKSL